MKEVISIFRVGDDHYKVQGYGQDAATAIMAQFPFQRIIFEGFMIDGKFIKFD